MSMHVKTLLIDNSQEILNMSDEAKQQALYKIGLAAEGYAKRLAPVDTGRLRNSITFATQTASGAGSEDRRNTVPGDYHPNGTPDANSVYIGTNVEYAVIQELKHNYIRNAVENHINEYRTLIENTYKAFNP